MRRYLHDAARALRLRRTRERQRVASAERFFSGDNNEFQWAEPLFDEQPLSPTWRLWLNNWSAVRRLADQLGARPQFMARFGSMPDVGDALVAGATVASFLRHWIRTDADLIELREPSNLWEVSLDIYERDHPRLVLIEAGQRKLDFGALGDGTGPWRWDFLPERLNTAAGVIKHLALADEAVDAEVLRQLLDEFGLQFHAVDRSATGIASALTFVVGTQPYAQRSFHDLSRALVAEIPGLTIKRV